MVRLVHSELILRFLGVVDLLVRVLHNLIYLNLVPNRGRRLRALHIADLHTLVLVDVVFAASGGSATRIGVDRTHSLVGGLADLASILHIGELCVALDILDLFSLLNVDSAAFAFLERALGIYRS